jgi:hypothetical protein
VKAVALVFASVAYAYLAWKIPEHRRAASPQKCGSA